MAKITIELDTTNDEDAALAAKLFAGAPPRAESATPFPTIEKPRGGSVASCMARFDDIQNFGAAPDLPRHPTQNPHPVPAAFTHGSPELDADAAKLEALAGPGSAGPVFAVPTPPAPPSGVTLAHESEVIKAAYPAEPSTVELDAAGLPWDARIHSESRARIADGTWRRKRGVDQVVVDLVTSELRAAYPTPTSQPAPAPAPVAAEVPPPPPPATPVVAPPPPVAAPAAPAARGVPDLAAAVARGTLSLADLNAACLQHGCANVLELNKNPAALTAVCAQFDAIGAFQ